MTPISERPFVPKRGLRELIFLATIENEKFNVPRFMIDDSWSPSLQILEIPVSTTGSSPSGKWCHSIV